MRALQLGSRTSNVTTKAVFRTMCVLHIVLCIKPWAISVIPPLPPVQLHARARAGADSPIILFQRRRWHAWFAGDLKEIIAVRGKMRSDKYPEEWVDIIIGPMKKGDSVINLRKFEPVQL